MELKKLKRIGIIILVLSLLLFTFSNLREVEIQLFFWQVPMPLALLIFLTALIGFVIGVFVALNIGKDKTPKVDPTLPPDPLAPDPRNPPQP